MVRCMGQKADETSKPIEFRENRQDLREPLSSGCDIDRVLRELSSSARTVEFGENHRVLRFRSSMVTTGTENSVVGCATK